ncbi:substrate-binding domain-containing protein [Leptolyngbya sp. 7M]|nr:substrate-binding domain-containing protein [Leptolyngbya sp. 7M]
MFLVGVGLCLTLAACNSAPNSTATSDSASPAQGGTVNLTLVSYAVTQAAYEQIIPKFAAKWKADHNQEVVFDQSYGGSGSQTRAVIDGLEADVVALALALDTKKIEKAGLIDAGWENEAPNNSIVHKRMTGGIGQRIQRCPIGYQPRFPYRTETASSSDGIVHHRNRLLRDRNTDALGLMLG